MNVVTALEGELDTTKAACTGTLLHAILRNYSSVLSAANERAEREADLRRDMEQSRLLSLACQFIFSNHNTKQM